LVQNTLDVETVHETLRDVGTYSGAGSQSRNVDAIAGLLANADTHEARYLVRTVLGTMRLGVGTGLVREALATAFLDGSDEAAAAIDRAYAVTNDFGLVAERVREQGREGLDDLGVELFRPVKPMLAHKADTMAQALEALGDETGEVLLETK
jgi:DNA ligase-1